MQKAHRHWLMVMPLMQKEILQMQLEKLLMLKVGKLLPVVKHLTLKVRLL